jgi:hypothetical protein
MVRAQPLALFNTFRVMLPRGRDFASPSPWRAMMMDMLTLMARLHIHASFNIPEAPPFILNLLEFLSVFLLQARSAGTAHLLHDTAYLVYMVKHLPFFCRVEFPAFQHLGHFRYH